MGVWPHSHYKLAVTHSEHPEAVLVPNQSMAIAVAILGVVLQIGTACVTRGQDSRLALGRLGALVEQLETLVRGGREVILVTSGEESHLELLMSCSCPLTLQTVFRRLHKVGR